MFKKLFLAAVLFAGFSPMAEAATLSVATANVNLRAGPSTAYPVVTVIPQGAGIVTYGCLPGYSWCDISLGPYRGWVSAGYIQVTYQGVPVALTPVVAPRIGVTVVNFGPVYWNTFYTAYPWYRSWASYAPYAPYPAGRVTSYERTVQCAGGSCSATRAATGLYGGSASQSRTCGGGECTAKREVEGPHGNTASRVRSCSANSASCSATRTGPQGGVVTRTFQR
ncbi:SH3 domain-containing protein [Aquabacter spiritensis]|uniref:Uncharacterized protein YraI n=1 Tax=Aquabacter spiritensis TaxID=933073 RepID=A0A4R3LQY0_9HYPH|nr:SH3 domain-containing protein [Aquabacter spiritensis]TCT02019.1 uncharacterized protein YraI [Aquabacter spiritensis]